jgi:glycosyltransferase involved in cell wall biosynthesis
VGSFSEIIETGKTGLLIPPEDNLALQNAIINLMSDNLLRRQMGENGHMKMRNELSWDKVISETIPVYIQKCKK